VYLLINFLFSYFQGLWQSLTQRRYNFVHSSTRTIIKHALWIFKGTMAMPARIETQTWQDYKLCFSMLYSIIFVSYIMILSFKT